MNRSIYLGAVAAVCLAVSFPAMAQPPIEGKQTKDGPSLGAIPFKFHTPMVLVNSKGCYFAVTEDDSSGALLIKKLNLENGDQWCETEKGVVKR